jgi:hypothetical protein
VLSVADPNTGLCDESCATAGTAGTAAIKATTAKSFLIGEVLH